MAGSGPTSKISSATFEAGGYSWLVLLFPKGSGKSNQTVSVFLKLVNAKKIAAANQPFAAFDITVMNRRQCEGSVTKSSEHKFSAKEDDWGFADFLHHNMLKHRREQFMPDGDLHVRVKIRQVFVDPVPEGAVKPMSAQADAPQDCASQAPVAAPPQTEAEARAAMKAAADAREAAQREVAVHTAKFEAAQARLALLQAEAKWLAAQAAVDSAMAGVDDDAEDFGEAD